MNIKGFKVVLFSWLPSFCGLSREGVAKHILTSSVSFVISNTVNM